MSGNPSRERDQTQIDGVVEREKFHSAETGYTVLLVTVDGQTQTLAGVHTSTLERGCKITATGRWEQHPKHGRQFRFEHLAAVAPSSLDQIKARLVTYPGVGPSTADKIIAALGPDTWTKLDADPGLVQWIRGISKTTADKFAQHHEKQSGPVSAIRNRLIDVGAPPSLAKSIHEAYGDRSLAMLADHPFRVAAKIERFGFGLAERFARATGMDPESSERVEAGVIHVLRDQRMRGHCCVPPAELTRGAMDLLRVREGSVDDAIDRLLDHGALRHELGMVYLTGMAVLEERVARRLRALMRPARVVWDAGDVPDHLADGQRDAVLAVARSGVTVLTGGPGTGKSATVSAVLDAAERAGVAVLLCAPTGRAAKRLSEASGRQASTIHRMLRPIAGSRDFHHDVQNPLPVGLVVVDEVSMVDLDLMDSLLAALTVDHRLLLVGDTDQLPSVGAGNILADVLEAALEAAADGANVATIRLTRVFRQAAGSSIVENAHRLLGGGEIVSDTGPAGQFYMLGAPTPEAVQDKIITMASNRIPHAYKFDAMSEVQILCPVHARAAGVEEFNRALQWRYSDKVEKGFHGPGGRKFLEGDRVMQTRNDYERNVFNGDLGVVKRYDADLLTVDFDGVEHRLTRFDAQALQLAYAMTIHKSQGGEFPAVLVPVLAGSRMMSRNLLYTAITRARSLCVLVGNIDAMRRAAATIPPPRWSCLAKRITATD